MPFNFVSIGLGISFIMHGIHFFNSWMNNRTKITNAIANIKDDVKDIIQNPSLENINKDVIDITDNVGNIVSNVETIEKTIIDIENTK